MAAIAPVCFLFSYEPMTTEILFIPGGVGLFLLGMLILTDGLRGLAGNALRRLLMRFTKSPLSGAATGALTTAVIQSSSATTVTTVGFVGAGLLTFPHALGVLFGANIGTTMTGWLIAIFGFKLDLGVIVLPVLLAGVLARMFGRGPLRHLGWALAGFSLLFVGLDALQQGMASFEGAVTPDYFPDDTFLGRLQLVLIGVAITLVTQSSSAGVATALVALGAGAISFPQAAAMVIGMDVGTTFSAVLATIGGSTAVRQTGYAHVIYNVMAAIMAFFLLDLYVGAMGLWAANGGSGDTQLFLVGFHTSFNVLGVLLALPFAGLFAKLIIRLVPEVDLPLAHRLDKRLLKDPAAATDAAMATIGDIAARLFDQLRRLLDPMRRWEVSGADLHLIEQSLAATLDYGEQIRTAPDQPLVHGRHLATMHALDHLSRLHRRCLRTAALETLQSDHRLRRLTRLLGRSVAALKESDDLATAETTFDRVRTLLRKQRRTYRAATLEAAARQQIDADEAVARLDSVRWLHRTAFHIWRILYHLREGQAQAKAEMPPPLVEDNDETVRHGDGASEKEPAAPTAK